MMDNDINDQRVSLKKQGYGLIQYDEYPVHSYPYDSPWITDARFSIIYDSIHSNTLVDRIRCYSLFLLTEQVREVPGDVLEVGVWRGGTAGLFTQLLQDRTVFLADTFEGVVKSSDWEHYSNKAHDDTSQGLVQNFLNNELKVKNFEIIKGIFPEESGKKIKDKKFALVYLDLDVYLSTKDAFNYIWEQVSINGIVVFDDYGMKSACEGISKFVDEIKNDTDKLFISNLNGQAYIIKRNTPN